MFILFDLIVFIIIFAIILGVILHSNGAIELGLRFKNKATGQVKTWGKVHD